MTNSSASELSGMFLLSEVVLSAFLKVSKLVKKKSRESFQRKFCVFVHMEFASARSRSAHTRKSKPNLKKLRFVLGSMEEETKGALFMRETDANECILCKFL